MGKNYRPMPSGQKYGMGKRKKKKKEKEEKLKTKGQRA
jgi:hypothetical protein